jgi:hypothetical protein
MPMHPRRIAAPAAVGMLLSVLTVAGQGLPTVLPAEGYAPQERDDDFEMPSGREDDLRRDALAWARLWGPAPDRLELRGNPGGPGSFATSDEVICKFLPKKSSGATPKFECVFAGGEVLKVKYGSAEVHTEVIATRLLQALGAGADHMYLVRKVRCFGCPENPHALLRCLSTLSEQIRRECRPLYGETSPTGEFKVTVDYGKYVDFGPAAIERRAAGKVIKTKIREGWGWDELDEAQAGRSPRADRDALRLLAAFINDWDNRAENQRLLCLPGGESADGRCLEPLAYIHDVGATFGHVGGETKQERKLDVEGWRSVPVWEDAAACRVRVKSPPLHGASFGEATISEPGRLFLARRLARLSRERIRDLFEGSGATEFEGARDSNRHLSVWVTAFEDKVRQITEREPCPER